MSLSRDPLRTETPVFGHAAAPLRQLFKGTVWSSVNVACGRVVPGILIIILAWWITPAQLGAVSFVLATYTVFSLVADWSIAYAVQKLIPEHSADVGHIAWTAILLRLALSVILGAACWALDAATGVFHQYGAYLALMLAASSFGIVSFVHNAKRNFSTASLVGAAVPIVWLAAALIMVKSGMPVTGPLLGLCIAYTAVGISAILADPVLRQRMIFVRKIAVEILRYGAWATLGTVLIGVVGQVGVLIVAYLEGDTAAAVFKVAVTFASVPAMFGMMILLPLMPIAKQHLINNSEISGLACQIVDYLVLIGLPMLTVGFALAPSTIHSFLKESYGEAIWPLRILLGANILRMMVTALSGILLVGEGLRILAGTYAVAAAVSLVGSVVLIRWAGLEGVAVALLISWSVATILLYRWFARQAPLHFEWRRYLQYCVSAIVAAAAAWLSTYLWDSPREALAAGLSLAAIIYPLLLWAQRAPALEKLAGVFFQCFVGEN